MTRDSTNFIPAEAAALIERCATLRLPAWWFDATGELEHSPDAFGLCDDLLASEPLTGVLRAAFETGVSQPSPAPVEVAPGCHALPICITQGMRCLGGMVVLTLTPEGLGSGWFNDLCSDAGVDAAVAKTACKLAISGADGSVQQDPAQLLMMLDWAARDLHQQEEDRASIDQFCQKLMQSYEEVNLMFRLSASMKCLPEPVQMLEKTCEEITDVLPFAWSCSLFLDTHGVVPDLAGRVVTRGELPLPDETFAQAAADMLLQDVAGWDETQILRACPLSFKDSTEVIAVPIKHGSTAVGALLAGGKRGEGQEQEVCSAEMKMLRASADFLSVFLDNATAFNEQKTLFMGTLRALTATIDAKDEYTRGHSQRVAMLAKQLAEQRGMDPEDIKQVHVAGLMHDVGKIGIAESVLGKAGRLTDDEFEQIKQHPVIGYRILKDIPQLERILDGVLYHHERFDGRGYPEGLAGKQIPLMGRLLAVCDTFDAMSSTRSYRQAMPREKVLAEIERSAGTQLDPDMVHAFLQLNLAEYDRALLRDQNALRKAA